MGMDNPRIRDGIRKHFSEHYVCLSNLSVILICIGTGTVNQKFRPIKATKSVYPVKHDFEPQVATPAVSQVDATTATPLHVNDKECHVAHPSVIQLAPAGRHPHTQAYVDACSRRCGDRGDQQASVSRGAFRSMDCRHLPAQPGQSISMGLFIMLKPGSSDDAEGNQRHTGGKRVPEIAVVQNRQLGGLLANAASVL